MPHGRDQQDAWEREYRAQQLLSPSNVPQADVMRFVRWLKNVTARGEVLGHSIAAHLKALPVESEEAGRGPVAVPRPVPAGS